MSRSTKKPDSDIFTRINAALPAAKELLAQGIDCRRAEFDNAIPAPEVQGLTDTQIQQLNAWTEATYVLGVAVGLLLNPVLLAKKGGV